MRRRTGQSTVEYAVVLTVVIAALLGMHLFMKRGVQGRLRSATDDIGEQYVPGQVTATHHVTSFSHTQQTLEDSGKSTSHLDENETQTRSAKGDTETVNTTERLWR